MECVTDPHRHNATLQTLQLRRNQIGDVGAAAIGEGLRCVHDDCDLHNFLLILSVTCAGVDEMEGSV